MIDPIADVVGPEPEEDYSLPHVGPHRKVSDKPRKPRVRKVVHPTDVTASEVSALVPSSHPDDPNRHRVAPGDIIAWLSGRSAKPPDNVSDALQDITNKVNWCIAFSIVDGLGRLQHLTNYLKQVEARLFRPEEIKDKKDVVLRKEHQRIEKSLLGFLEFSRKFILQNKDQLESVSRDRDALLAAIRTLSTEELRTLTEILSRSA